VSSGNYYFPLENLSYLLLSIRITVDTLSIYRDSVHTLTLLINKHGAKFVPKHTSKIQSYGMLSLYRHVPLEGLMTVIDLTKPPVIGVRPETETRFLGEGVAHHLTLIIHVSDVEDLSVLPRSVVSIVGHHRDIGRDTRMYHDPAGYFDPGRARIQPCPIRFRQVTVSVLDLTCKGDPRTQISLSILLDMLEFMVTHDTFYADLASILYSLNRVRALIQQITRTDDTGTRRNERHKTLELSQTSMYITNDGSHSSHGFYTFSTYEKLEFL
jgi:hypothetical protein